MKLLVTLYMTIEFSNLDYFNRRTFLWINPRDWREVRLQFLCRKCNSQNNEDIISSSRRIIFVLFGVTKSRDTITILLITFVK